MTARQLVQSGAGMLSMYSTPRSTAPRCFNCNTFIGEGACKCRVYVVHCLPGMLANGQKTRSYTNPKAFDDYIAFKGEQGAKDAGKMRAEGKEYVVKDGDVLNFLFNV